MLAESMGSENGAPLEDDISLVEYYQNTGIRYVTLTQGKDNKICDSSYDITRTHGGLSEYSKQVVDHIDRVVELTRSLDNIDFGSDYDGAGDSLPTGMKDVSTYLNLIFELLKRGYTEEQTAKICYINVFKV